MRFAVARLTTICVCIRAGGGQIPMLGNRHSAEFLLRAVRAAERSDAADILAKRVVTAPPELSDIEPVTPAATDRRDKGCELAGLDGWLSSAVAAYGTARAAGTFFFSPSQRDN